MPGSERMGRTTGGEGEAVCRRPSRGGRRGTPAAGDRRRGGERPADRVADREREKRKGMVGGGDEVGGREGMEKKKGERLTRGSLY